MAKAELCKHDAFVHVTAHYGGLSILLHVIYHICVNLWTCNV